mgnify:FL=1
MSEAPPPRVNIPLVPCADHLGLQIHMAVEGRSEVRYTPLPEHLNSFHVVHGGVCMTLLDVTMATAARSLEEGMGVVTIEMKSSFMRPAQGDLVGEGRILHRTATMAFVEASIRDAKGQLCTHGTGTFKYVRKLAVGSRKAQSLQLPQDMQPVIATD